MTISNNETALHIAIRNQHKETIKILLLYDAQRSLRNVDDHQAYELAKIKEIKDLFQRPKCSRFAFLHNFYKTTSLFQHKIKCKSCSLVNDNTFYEWELVDRNASQKALRFRRELKLSISMNEKCLYSIKKGYINARLQDVSTVDGLRICNYSKRALI